MFRAVLCLALWCWSAGALELRVDRVALRTGESVELRLQPGDGVTWTADRGTVSVTGGRAFYKAPATPGWAVVTAEAGGAHRSVVFLIYKQLVILKADDLWPTKTGTGKNPRWVRYFDYLRSHRMVSSAGVVMEPYLTSPQTGVDYVRELGHSGWVELWCHGYDHSSVVVSGSGQKGMRRDWESPLPDDWVAPTKDLTLYEFQGRTYEEQLDHLRRAQEGARNLLGVTFTAFGAPFNRIDAATAEALSACPEITTWLFYKREIGGPKPNYYLSRGGGEIESPSGTPNFAYFVKSYKPTQAIVTLQLHPANTSYATKFDELTQVLSYLEEQDVTFIRPSACAELLKHKVFPLVPDDDSDRDGMSDCDETCDDPDDDGLPNFLDEDSDDDGLDDATEHADGRNPYGADPSVPLNPWPLALVLLAIGACRARRKP